MIQFVASKVLLLGMVLMVFYSSLPILDFFQDYIVNRSMSWKTDSFGELGLPNFKDSFCIVLGDRRSMVMII